MKGAVFQKEMIKMQICQSILRIFVQKIIDYRLV